MPTLNHSKMQQQSTIKRHINEINGNYEMRESRERVFVVSDLGHKSSTNQVNFNNEKLASISPNIVTSKKLDTLIGGDDYYNQRDSVNSYIRESMQQKQSLSRLQSITDPIKFPHTKG